LRTKKNITRKIKKVQLLFDALLQINSKLIGLKQTLLRQKR
jgi:hypothetical protein